MKVYVGVFYRSDVLEYEEEVRLIFTMNVLDADLLARAYLDQNLSDEWKFYVYPVEDTDEFRSVGVAHFALPRPKPNMDGLI